MKLGKIICILTFVCAAWQGAFAQDDKWVRVQSDNGEFSIEVPDKFSYFFDRAGFQVSSGSSDFPLREVSILNAFRNGTLLSFEVYRASGDAIGPLIETSVSRGTEIKKSSLNSVQAREVVKVEDTFHFVSHYFKSKQYIYAVTALSRTGDVPEVKRFFDSLRFAPGAKAPLPDVRRLSTISVSPVDIKTMDVAPAGRTTPTDRPVPTPYEKPLIIASRPRASYVDAARSKNVQGKVQLRIEFGKDAYISNIEVLKTLPEGIFRQALFAALRLKFLPAERNGEPVAVKRTVEYGFSIY